MIFLLEPGNHNASISSIVHGSQIFLLETICTTINGSRLPEIENGSNLIFGAAPGSPL
jgi:hypothetical protein